MKIGDKVRFLNDVGGGVITGFQGRDIVLVSDADGFEIPTLIKDVVVIDTNDLNIAKKAPQPKPAKTIAKPQDSKAAEQLPLDEEPDPADRPMTFRPRAVERRGGEQLSLFLAFVPVDIKNVTDTAFEAYLINDCNYYIRYAILTHDSNACLLRHEGELAPNTKTFLEEFRRDVLDDWKRLTVQVIAFKRDKTFLAKPALSIGLRIDGTKFYKLHTFQPSDFFNEPSLIYDIVVNDRPARELFIDANKMLPVGSTPPKDSPKPEKMPTTSRDRNAIIEVDLHATELLDTLVGMQPKDILDYQLKVFRDTMSEHLKEHGCRIVFIHGKGEGVLRNAILTELRTHYPQCRHQDASFREYGFGATLVTI